MVFYQRLAGERKQEETSSCPSLVPCMYAMVELMEELCQFQSKSITCFEVSVIVSPTIIFIRL